MGTFTVVSVTVPVALIYSQHHAVLPHCSGLYLHCDMQAVALANTVLMTCILFFFLRHTDYILIPIVRHYIHEEHHSGEVTELAEHITNTTQ